MVSGLRGGRRIEENALTRPEEVRDEREGEKARDPRIEVALEDVGTGVDGGEDGAGSVAAYWSVVSCRSFSSNENSLAVPKISSVGKTVTHQERFHTTNSR